MKLYFHHKFSSGYMLQWQHLPVPVYDYPKRFSLLCLWTWIFKDIGAIEVL